MKNKRSFGWYLGAAIAGMLILSLTTCIAGVIIKFTLTFLTWLF